jgi:hypothetical protein
MSRISSEEDARKVSEKEQKELLKKINQVEVSYLY